MFKRTIIMKKKRKIMVAVVAVIIVAAIATVWILMNNPLSEQERVRDEAMRYIKTNHPETASLMENIKWEGGIRNNYEAGLITYIYSSPDQGWTVIIQSPETSIHNYNIQVVCTQGGGLVNWHGLYQDNAITETSMKNTP